MVDEGVVEMGRRHHPAVRDITRDGRWSTYDVSALKKMGAGGGGRCAKTGHPLKLPSPTKLSRQGHFPPASQAGRLAGPVFYAYAFSLEVGSGMGLFLIGGHWPKILPQKSKGTSKMCVLCMCTVYGVLFYPPLWLKFVPGWPAISVRS
jgi:hypothetical protein